MSKQELHGYYAQAEKLQERGVKLIAQPCPVLSRQPYASPAAAPPPAQTLCDMPAATVREPDVAVEEDSTKRGSYAAAPRLHWPGSVE